MRTKGARSCASPSIITKAVSRSPLAMFARSKPARSKPISLKTPKTVGRCVETTLRMPRCCALLSMLFQEARNRPSHLSVGAISSPSPLHPNCSTSASKCITWLIVSAEGFSSPVTQCHGFDSNCRIRQQMSARFLLQHLVRFDCRVSRCGDRVASPYIWETRYDQHRHGIFSSL